MAASEPHDDCTRPRLSEDHGEHGHYCSECGGEFPDPEECYECALEAMGEELERLKRDRYYLLKHLRRWHDHNCQRAPGECSTCTLINQVDPPPSPPPPEAGTAGGG